MPQVNEEELQIMADTINRLLQRPANQFASKAGEPTKFSSGHFHIEKMSTGWLFEEQMGDRGAAILLAEKLTESDMALFLRGYIAGIGVERCNDPRQYLRA